MRAKLKEIYVGRRQRRDYGGDELEDLRRDMDENGQITAITVRPPSDFDREEPEYNGEPWVLVAGGRRVMAAALAGWEDIEAFAREELSELVHRILELHENLKRKEMTWQEEVEAKSEIVRLRKIENPKLTDGEIAKELGQHASTFSRDLQTAEAVKKNPNLKKAASKSAALGASKQLAEYKAREVMAKASQSKVQDAAGSLEERVQTAKAEIFVSGLPEDSIDLALLDGPYGYDYWKLGQKSKKETDGKHLSNFDDSPEATGLLYEALLPELTRVIRPTGWLTMFCGMETFILLQELTRKLCAEHHSYRLGDSNLCAQSTEGGALCRFLTPEPFPWIWYRPNSRNQPRFPHLHAKNMAELIFVCNMGKAKILKLPAPSVLVHDAEYGEGRIHVNQKPMALYRELIERLTFTGDSVLDCFFGSGNSLAAATSIARVPYGCDSNEEMLPFALGRIRAHSTVITKEAIEASRKRYMEGLGEPIAEPLPVEEEEFMPGLLGTEKPFIMDKKKKLLEGEGDPRSVVAVLGINREDLIE